MSVTTRSSVSISACLREGRALLPDPIPAAFWGVPGVRRKPESERELEHEPTPFEQNVAIRSNALINMPNTCQHMRDVIHGSYLEPMPLNFSYPTKSLF